MNGHFKIGAVTPSRYFFSIAFFLGLLFAMISPDDQQSQLSIFLQWQLQTLIPMAILILIQILLLRIKWLKSLPQWLILIFTGVIAASLFSPIALLIDVWLDPTQPTNSLGKNLYNEWLNITPPIALCWLTINLPWLLGYRIKKIDDKAQDNTLQKAKEEKVPFMQLVPEEIQGSLIFLKSELHYLQVTTVKGSALILYNLRDAVTELPDNLGLMVHRSYWVSLDSIKSVKKQGRQGEIQLQNNGSIPISRNKLNNVVEKLEQKYE